ncbi:hypothetical protein DFH11DRAFT_787618 [Phellopilus nigrolimitatus]|nr:hypothetical protein DFH11DRAFT_787618 [Phellopilus nigrolimitatus]
MDISIQNRLNPPHTTLRRRRADPTGARAIAAKFKNRFPCTACKKSRQKCSGGPPANETCDNCKKRKKRCISEAPDVTDLRIIEESGKSPTVSQRASTSSRGTTSTVDSEHFLRFILILHPSGEAKTCQTIFAPETNNLNLSKPLKLHRWENRTRISSKNLNIGSAKN